MSKLFKRTPIIVIGLLMIFTGVTFIFQLKGLEQLIWALYAAAGVCLIVTEVLRWEDEASQMRYFK